MVLIGAGGACIDTLSFFNLKNTPIFDDYKVGSVMGNRIYGTVDDLIRMRPTDDIFNCIGSVGDNTVRNRIYEKLKAAGIKTKPLLLCSFLSQNVQIGQNCILNVGSQIHHDCIIGESCVISPSVTICGNVKLGNNCFVGVGTNIIQGVTIGENSVIGAGSLILKDIPPNKKVYGIWKG